MTKPTAANLLGVCGDHLKVLPLLEGAHDTTISRSYSTPLDTRMLTATNDIGTRVAQPHKEIDQAS